MSTPGPATETKKTTTRGPSFTPHEDACVARAYLRTSEDPILGTDRKNKMFYEGVAKVYNTVYKPVNRAARSVESIRNRVKLLTTKCQQFSSCYTRVLRANPSGYTDDDKLNMCTALYNGIEFNTPNDDVGEPFKFLQAWNHLRKHPKFSTEPHTSANEKDQTNISVEDNAISPTESVNSKSNTPTIEERAKQPVKEEPQVRPKGRKAAKDMMVRQKQHEERMNIAREAVALQKERSKELKRQNDIMLFTTKGIDCAEAQDYLRITSKRVLEELRADAGKKQKVGTTPSPKTAANDATVAVIASESHAGGKK